MGGLKAVVWTDVIQIVIMIGSLFLIMIKGTYDVGGLGVIWERNYDSGRIAWPSFSFDPTVRHTFWSLIIGGSFFWCHTTPVNQSLVQRFLALPTLQSARRALIIYVVGVSTLLVMVSYNGFILYAAYHDCDPITTKLAKKKDQMIPIFVMDILGDYPGIPGVFIAGVFSAALSTLSTVLNAMSAIVLQDFVKPLVKGPVSIKMSDYVMRGTVIVFGLIAFALVFIVEKLGTVLQLAISFGSLSLGPMLGIFTMGMFMPWISATSALIGGACGMMSSAYIVLRAQADIASGVLRFPQMPVSVEGCTYHFANVTQVDFDYDGIDKSLHHISYLYYTMAGTLVSCAVGCVASFFVGHNKLKDMNPKLVAPFLRNFYFYNIENVEKDEEEEVEHKLVIKDNKL
jgi:Na+/proline symporter